tara:strand:- start:4205 stop:7441 length:3237 start_codon:yes stop_codon:yes gene_type:complete
MSKEKQGFHNIIKKYINDVPYVKSNENSDPELEIRFGTFGNKKISRIDFDNVCKNLISHGFKTTSRIGKSILRISNEYVDRNTGKTKTSNIRTELIGKELIQQYCKTNRLPESNKDYNFVQKTMAKNSDNTSLLPQNINTHNLRIAYSIENNIYKDSKMATSIVESWNDSKKVFRYINRTTFVHDDYPINIDCSIVKSSTKNKNYLVSNYTVQEANLFNNPEAYEIEIEVDNTKTEGYTTEKLETTIMKCIKYILAGLQQTNYPVSYLQLEEVGKSYLALIKNTSTYLKPNTFIGPNSFTLQKQNIIPLTKNNNIPNINNNYSVTDKADGLRKLLYIHSDGMIYLINTNMNIEFTGCKSENNKYFNTIIDGEHISHNKNGKFINLYACFDIYFINKKDVRSNSFIKTNNDDDDKKLYRLQLLNEILNDLLLVGITGKSVPIRISPKKFYVSNDSVSIFMACKQIIDLDKNNGFEYETDGLIFTPCDYGVGLTKENTQLKSTKTSWEYSFKWKPSYYNTIDFYITTKKLENGEDVIKTIFENGTNTSSTENILQYKVIILRVGFDEKKDGYINPCLDIINDNIPKFYNTDDNDSYKPTPFYPTNPYDSNANICYIPLKKDNNGNLQMFTKENEIFTDNTIVEFSYDLSKDGAWRWIPLKVRWDKTAELKNGGRNYGNSYNVANSNWQTIHNPITEEMISTGSNIDENIDDIYYTKLYGKSNTKALRDFHNLYVKMMLIKGPSQSGYTLIDLAVGKGGDFPKWIDSKLSFIFGIDLSKDNIENRIDGACARYLNYKKKFKNMPDVLFVNGNSSLNIKSGEAILSEKEKIITKAVFGMGEKSERVLGKGVVKNYGKGKDGFDICSCQFALHYFFENMVVLSNFIQNVADSTKIGGHFIGTCYDGNLIFNELKSLSIGQGTSLFKNDLKIWEIIKQYENNEFKDDETSLGYSIDVFQETIGKSFKEYLVNFTFFKNIMENYGFVLLSKDEANSINLPNSNGLFSDLHSHMQLEVLSNKELKKNIGESLKMSEEEKKISFYNRYFIFKKERHVGNIKLDKTSPAKIKIKPTNIKKLSKRIIIK